jgi:hypothetical protein
MAKDRDAMLRDLRAKHPDWYIWYVAKAFGRTTWLAGKPSNMIATYEAQSPEELDTDLSETQTSARL